MKNMACLLAGVSTTVTFYLEESGEHAKRPQYKYDFLLFDRAVDNYQQLILEVFLRCIPE